MSDPIRVISKVRNNRLMEARERLGLSVRQFAARAGVSYGHYNDIENMSRMPSEASADKIAAAALVPVDVLFPAYLGSIKQNTSTRTILEDALLSLEDAECSKLLAPANGQDEIEAAKDAIEQALETLPPRYQMVIQMRFGLSPETYPMTLCEIGERLGVTKERVRQIEAYALRKLRRPKMSWVLRDLLGVQ